MKKKKIVILTILLIILSVVAVILWINRNNISALYRFMKYSQDDIQSQISDNNSALLEAIKEYIPIDNIRDFTEEEEKMLSEGLITPEEAVNLLFKENTDESAGDMSDQEQNTASTEPGLSSSLSKSASTLSDEECENRMKEYIKTLYTVKADFTAKLGEVEKNVKNDYSKLDESEKNLSGKQKIIMKYWNDLVKLEKECDALIKDVVSSLKDFLTENDLDTSICGMIQRYYDEEKELKKAYYMKRLTE